MRNVIHKVTEGNTLVALVAQLQDGEGNPIDIAGDTITLTAYDSGGTAKISAASVTNKQQGDGTARITDITQADPPVITTSAAHGLTDGDPFFIDDKMRGMSELHGRQFNVKTAPTATTLEIDNEDSTIYEAYISGGAIVTRGLVSYTFATGDVDTPGDYGAYFIRTNGGATEHVPAGRKFIIRVVALD